jgi:hypothetical protein
MSRVQAYVSAMFEVEDAGVGLPNVTSPTTDAADRATMPWSLGAVPL